MYVCIYTVYMNRFHSKVVLRRFYKHQGTRTCFSLQQKNKPSVRKTKKGKVFTVKSVTVSIVSL